MQWAGGKSSLTKEIGVSKNVDKVREKKKEGRKV